jgi:hypothetical protein
MLAQVCEVMSCRGPCSGGSNTSSNSDNDVSDIDSSKYMRVAVVRGRLD